MNGGHETGVPEASIPSSDSPLSSLYSQILKTTIDGFWLIDTNGYLIEVNHAAAEMLGYTPDEMIGRALWDIDATELPEDTRRRVEQLINCGEARFETKHRCRNGLLVDVDVSSSYLPEKGGRLIAFTRDISHRKRAESEREITISLLRLVGEADDVHGLIQNVCLLMREWSGCEAVGIRLKAGEDYPYCEARGFPPEFVQAENHLCAVDENGRVVRDGTGNPIIECMCGNVICARFDPSLPFFTENGSFWSNCTTRLLASTSEAERQARTRNRCNGDGYESVALIPLRHGTETLGLLQFNDRRPNRFTLADIHLYERLASNLALGLLQRQAAAELNASEEKYRALFENMHQGAFLQRADGELVDVNPAALRILGLSREEFLGRTSDNPEWAVVREDGSPLPPPEHPSMRALATGEPVMRETAGILNARTGERVWLEVNAIPQFRNGEPKPFQVLVTIHDVTRRKMAEDALRQSEEQLSLVIDASTDGFWDWDIAGGQAYFSPRYYTMLGYTPGAFDGSYESWRSLVHPEDLVRTERAIQRHLEGSEPHYSIEFRMRAKDGSYRWILGRGKAVAHDAEGRVSRTVGTHSDITERKQAEDERERLHAQLVQSQKMESVGRLAGGVAHDFNNMLSVILGQAEMALERVPSEHPLHADLREIQKAAQRSADLTRQLLAFARRQTVSPKVLDLNETVVRMLKMLRRLIGENIELMWMPGPQLWEVKVDPSQIDQILANLCVNARDALGGGGRITIATKNARFDDAYCDVHPGYTPGDYVMLSISDDGCGMDPLTMEHLFEPFFTTKEVGEGTGLGLSTVYGTVKQNNGMISVHSEEGAGSTFEIFLPRYVGKKKESPAPVKPSPSTITAHETVLLVEDDAALLRMTASMLKALGYAVLPALSPGEALALAEAHQGEIHLLLTDVVMPEMNGRALAKRLLSLHPGIRRVFMSGYTAEIIAHHGAIEGGVHFLQKPFTLRTLQAKMAEASRRCEAQGIGEERQ